MTTRKVPFFDYPRLWTDRKEFLIQTIDNTASSGGFIMQKSLFNFEKSLGQFVNSPFALGVGNATDAMEIFLQAIGLEQGDEVIISSHTMIATASAIISAGGTPIPVDIGPDGLMDIDSMCDAINSKTVGIMPTQLNGRTCKMDKIIHEVEKRNLFLVEDAAQALGSKYKDKSAGTFGLASCISFFPAKVLGCIGDGGGLLSSDEDIYNKCYQIRDHGRDQEGEILCWGRNSRLDNIQAELLNVSLSDYGNIIKRRREIAQIYQELLGDIEQLNLPPSPFEDEDHFDIYQNYELVAEDRDKLKEYLAHNEIGTLIQWGGTAIHHFKQLGFSQHLENTDKFFEGCLMIPMNVFLDDDDVEYVSSKIKAFYS